MLVVNESQLNDFINKLKEEFDFFDFRDKYSRASVKKHFFPAFEEIFSADKKGKILTSKVPKKEFVLFGLSYLKLEALTYLDEIMEKPKEDFFYFQKRKKSIIVGLVEEVIDVAPGGDIVLQKIGDGKYKVFENTTKGKKIINEYEEFFSIEDDKGKAPQIPQGTSLTEWSKGMRELLLDPELLANAVEWSREGAPQIWEELAERCLGCGICTYVCPICHCFSIEDRVGLDDKCSRCRKWDACTLPGFAKIAGGHSFRATIKERYYNWFYHKFVRAYKEFGKSQCVGCGACKHNCPAQIDIQEILKEILENYKNKNG